MTADTVIHALRDRWKEQGILNEHPATEADISVFEARCGVVLPPDLRLYFLMVNGTVTGQFGLDDDDLIGFWHLDQIHTFAEEERGGGVGNPEALRTFILADLSIWIYGFGIQLFADLSTPTPVASDSGPVIYQIAGSFTEFIEGYLRGDPNMIYPTPPDRDYTVQ